MLGAKNRDTNFEGNLETGEPDAVTEMPSETNLVRGSLWMLAIAMLLFFLPVINGIIGGLIGGFKVGSTKNAVMAAILPAIVAALLLWMLLSVVDLPVMGIPGSPAIMALLITLSGIGLLLGAAVGGTLAQNKIDRLNRA